MKLEQLDGFAIGNLVNRREIKATEVMEYFLRRIEARNPSLRAFTYWRAEEALEAAANVDKKLDQHQYVGPFSGVPVGLKDFLPSKKGWTNSHGGVPSLVREDEADSMFCAAAEKLGAVVVGKTNAPAFGFSGACQNVMYGSTANPFDTTRTSGGSSGGSASAVADGLLAFAEGGDAGGSIRIPSGWCNLFGYKPSVGTVSSYCRPDGWTATHPYCFNGCLTKSVRDSAIMLSEMAQYNPRDPISLPILNEINFKQSFDHINPNVKIAYTADFDLYPVDPRVRCTVEAAVKKLEDSGASVERVSFNWKHSLDEMLYCWCWAISIDTALDLAMWKEQGLDLVGDHRDELPEEFIYFNEVAANAGIFDFRHFNEIRTDILDNFEDVLENYDFLISPTATCLPMPLADNGRCEQVGGVKLNPQTNFISFAETPLVNFIGYPAASIPAGYVDNIPVGMQIITKQYEDYALMRLCRHFEKLQPWDYSIAHNRKL